MKKIPLLMTPGPTQVAENVRMARAFACTNPDIDTAFTELYERTCKKIGQLLYTQNDIRIMSGEGILGLEMACASLTEQNDRVLVLDNGIFGEGFADFVTLYGGEPILFKSDWKRETDLKALEAFLQEDHDFAYATIVHCDTPTGVLNPIDKICPLLKSYGILTVVDSVSAMIGEPIKVDEWGVDLALGATQKCISAAVGLTFLSISEAAWQKVDQRKEPIRGFYCNLSVWKDCIQKKWYPYTMPISDIQSLEVAIGNIIEEGIETVWRRHEAVAAYVREALCEIEGFSLYLESGFSNTVTAVQVENAPLVRKRILEKYNILLGGSLGDLDQNIIRIGHMGENCYMEYAKILIEAFKQI
jgi:aspartate aminotransferase-like enzyme